MAAPASPLTPLNSPAQLPRAKSRRPAAEDTDRYQDRYRLHVVATNIADVVTSLGGLIFDRRWRDGMSRLRSTEASTTGRYASWAAESRRPDRTARAHTYWPLPPMCS